jgi:hypothetical protein
MTLSAREERRAREALRRHPDVTEADVAAAEERIADLLPGIEAAASPFTARDIAGGAVLTIVIAFAMLAPLAFLAAVLTRGGLLFRGLGIAVVGPDGREAGWGRALLRSALAWSPGLLFWTLPLLRRVTALPEIPFTVSGGALLTLLVVGGTVSILRPDRGIPDLLAGTRLVRR